MSRRSSSGSAGHKKLDRKPPEKSIKRRKLSPANLSDSAREALTKRIEETWQSYYHKYYSCINSNPEIVLEMQKEYLRSYKGFFKEDPCFEYYYVKVAKPEDLREALTLRIDRGSPGPDPNDPSYKANIAMIENSKFRGRRSRSPPNQKNKKPNPSSPPRTHKYSPKRSSRYEKPKRRRTPSPYRDRKPYKSRSRSYERRRSKSGSYERKRSSKYDRRNTRDESPSREHQKTKTSKEDIFDRRVEEPSPRAKPIDDLLKNAEVSRIAGKLLQASGSLQPWLAVSTASDAKSPPLATKPQSSWNAPIVDTPKLAAHPKSIIKTTKPASIVSSIDVDTKNKIEPTGSLGSVSKADASSSSAWADGAKPDDQKVQSKVSQDEAISQQSVSDVQITSVDNQDPLTQERFPSKSDHSDRFKTVPSTNNGSSRSASHSEGRFKEGTTIVSESDMKTAGLASSGEERFQSASSNTDRFKAKPIITSGGFEPVLTSTTQGYVYDSHDQNRSDKKPKSILERLGSKKEYDSHTSSDRKQDRTSRVSRSSRDRHSKPRSHSRSPSRQHEKINMQKSHSREGAIVEVSLYVVVHYKFTPT